ncbi:Hypothetical predicted protein [Paramuricea clavata]|uniref:Uncharacterized protein n=1 Tax=Paramuricea clavata TaxID=317549 RepID=A0A7D9EI11_PARCT|nr:Hypothetical predicted protein [Paramuricea clavata]
MDAPTGRDEQHRHRQHEEAFDYEPNASAQDEQSALHGQLTSSQSMNSDVSNEQFAKTLSTMIKTMANMAAILGQIWQHINSGGKTAKAKKRQQENQYSSESERDEHTVKCCRSTHENEDSLSLTASDDEESIEPALKPEFQKVCHAAIPPNSKFLFGDDLAKLVRDSEETNSTTRTLTLTGNTNKCNSHTYSREDINSYTGDNRGRNTSTKPFLWRGQKPYRRRPGTRGSRSQNQQRK